MVGTGKKRGRKQSKKKASGLPWSLLRRLGLWTSLLSFLVFSLALTVYIFFFQVYPL